MAATTPVNYDAIIIGAGFSGIRSLWELNQIGLKVKCFESGSDVGGAWYWNRYPGEAWVYAMNFMRGLEDHWAYKERYPAQAEVQQYLGRVADGFDLRKLIQFNTRVRSAHYDTAGNLWNVTYGEGSRTTCRYVLAATGPLSLPKATPFAGVDSFAGEVYQAALWPKKQIEFRGKKIAVIGTGATGVQIIPKIAAAAKELTVFQRTPNYVLPARNYVIDEYQAREIKANYNETWSSASSHPFGLAMQPLGLKFDSMNDADLVRRTLDAGWESGGFHLQFETFDDIFTNKDTNDVVSGYLRDKIHAIVRDPVKADLLSPKYPFASKRPPCGHFYYETYNRSNVNLVDIRGDNITLYEKGIRTESGAEYEFDMIIIALGFDAGTGALKDIDIQGENGASLKTNWDTKLETFAGVLISGFPNFFSVCGPHIPFGNMPVVLDMEVKWIGETLRYMEKHNFDKIDVRRSAAEAWSYHVEEAFQSILIADSARSSGAWFVGANVPGKGSDVLFYFGGLPNWYSWLKDEENRGWSNMIFSKSKGSDTVGDDHTKSVDKMSSQVQLDVASKA